MNRLVPAGLALAAATLLGATPVARAFADGGCLPAGVTCVEKVITCYRTETRVRQVPVTVNRQITREVEAVEKYTVAVPEWKPQKREVFVYKAVPKEVERTVFAAVPVVPAPAPAPGCGHGCGPGCGHGWADLCRTEVPTAERKFKTVECEDSFEKVTFTEQVCTYRNEERTRVVKRQVVENVPQTVLKTETYTVQVPYQVTVKVPVGGLPSGCGH